MRDAIYLRVSKDDQAAPDKFSIPSQERECRNYSEKSGGAVVKVYLDDGVSAFSDDIDARPEFIAMLEDAQQGLFDRLIVYAFDRFARDVWVFFHCDRILRKAGATLLSATEHHDPDSPDGVISKGIRALFAHAESQKIRKRVRDALSEKALRGGWLGRVPYGYTWEDGSIVVDKSTASGYHMAVRLVTEGATGFREIARMLNAAGYRTATGKLWIGASVAYMLRSPAYLGMVIVRDGNGRIHTLPGTHEPLIDRPTWERLQVKIREHMSGQKGGGRAHRHYPLSGTLYCARCGHKAHGLGSSQTRDYR